ncbi:GNAT family N-acetyltransferase [Clostridium sp. 'White wine YQ']|uniref:GNAT family N-acetyltransferase n=1 Tax=Clostridium sp. 'White wine YQ' TaxID=3027474 RepID=UPI00236651D6|nr:GNAT family N-acetyltransferase [Clostridium sp. 'White wine YQ']MDD7795099.1 GNAT family N-acetyltransferase [Clostridium sp. 'White wine YQ']
MNNDFTIRAAKEEDIPSILGFIKELAEYENLLDQVVATEEILKEWLFNKKSAEVLIGELDGESVGYALFFHSFSTFLGRAGIYLEDLYIRPNQRGKGFGKDLLTYLANLALERGCGRLEWSCLDWNEPSIKFYKSLGAKPLEDWTMYRVDGDALKNLATNKI